MTNTPPARKSASSVEVNFDNVNSIEDFAGLSSIGGRRRSSNELAVFSVRLAIDKL